MQSWFLALLLLSTGPAHAKGWLLSTCDRLLGVHSEEATPEMRDVAESWRAEVHRENRFWAHRFSVRVAPAEVLAGRPLAVQVDAQLAEKQWHQPLDIRLLVRPDRLQGAWQDGRSTDLCPSTSAVLVFDDVFVRRPDGQMRRLSEFMQEQFARILKSSSGLQMQLHVETAETYTALPLASRARGKTVAWLQGNIQNFQFERTLLLLFQHAVNAAAADPLLAGPLPHGQ